MHDFEFLIPITFFSVIAVILFKFFDDRHRERMMIIEKGLASDDVKALSTKSWTWRLNPLTSLKWGMLAAFIGCGILVGSAMGASINWIDEDKLMTGFIFLFGGLGLILFYAMAAKKAESGTP